MTCRLILIMVVIYSNLSCKVLEDLAMQPSTFETVSALKEVLNSSAFRSITALKKMNDGGVEALLPAELQPVLGTLKTIGLGKELDDVSKQIVDVSGLVVEESGYIMSDAIKQIDFGDAVAVVVGGEDAATQVLREAMYVSVKNRYSTRLEEELAKGDALRYWPLATGAYNIFAKNKIESSLPDFLAERSVDALFIAMGKEESKIRKDPASLGKAVVTKVFDYYSNKKQY